VRVTEKLTDQRASYGITVISGLARGIDSIAHSSALKAQGRTIAVLGSGVSYIYPPENKYLAEKIVRNGAILSEFYPDEKPQKEHFPKRNRIISGMSIAILVTEAGENSGALITASFALDQGREVFAVPGNITSENSKGTNFLIKKGAKLVQTVEDILEEIKQFIPSLKETIIKSDEKFIELREEEKVIFDILKEPHSIDEIVYKTRKNISEILATLLNLEIKGAVIKIEGRYVRRH
ncbi:MAG: DNA-processing protein DprA, partial [Thermodesulfovibrionaceae bacterium]